MKFARDLKTGLLVPQRDISLTPGLSQMDLQWFAEIWNIDGEDAGEPPLWEWDDMWKEEEAEFLLSTDAAHRGEAGYKIVHHTINDFAYGRKSLDGVGSKVYVRYYDYFPTVNYPNSQSVTVRTPLYSRIGSSYDDCLVGVQLSMCNSYVDIFRVRYFDQEGQVATVNVNIALGAWHYIEYYYKVHATEGAVGCWLDGVPVLLLSDLNTSGNTIEMFDGGYMSVGGTGLTDGEYSYMDDFKADTEGPIGPVSQKYYQSAAGIFAPNGALAKNVKTTKVGIFASNGALIKNIKTTKVGNLTFTGLASKKGFVPRVGTLTFSGTTTSFAKKVLSGVLSFGGDIRKNVKTVLLGSFSLGGSLVKKGCIKISGIFAATGTFSTALLKFKFLAGIFAPTGVLIKNTKIAKAGSLTFTGIIIKKGFVAAIGTLTFSGLLDSILKPIARGLLIVAAKEPMEPKISGVQEVTKPKVVKVE